MEATHRIQTMGADVRCAYHASCQVMHAKHTMCMQWHHAWTQPEANVFHPAHLAWLPFIWKSLTEVQVEASSRRRI